MTILDLKGKLPAIDTWKVIAADDKLLYDYTGEDRFQAKLAIWLLFTVSSKPIESHLKDLQDAIKNQEAISPSIFTILEEAFNCKIDTSNITTFNYNGYFTYSEIPSDIYFVLLALIDTLKNNDFIKVEQLYKKFDLSSTLIDEIRKYNIFCKQNGDLSKSPGKILLASLNPDTFEKLLKKNDKNFFNIFTIGTTNRIVDNLADVPNVLLEYYFKDPANAVIPTIKIKGR